MPNYGKRQLLRSRNQKRIDSVPGQKGGSRMETARRLEELRELLESRQYTGLRQELSQMNEADIAAVMEELEEEQLLKIFRILPKDLAADVFAYMDVDNQQFIITSLSERDAANIIDNLMADDATDLLEEMPASIVKKLLAIASPETRRAINQLLRYPEDCAGSIMTVEFVDLKENLTVTESIERIRNLGLDSETINNCYVLDTRRKLVGTVTLRSLLLSRECGDRGHHGRECDLGKYYDGPGKGSQTISEIRFYGHAGCGPGKPSGGHYHSG